jgi:dienelactone hydrolase
VNQYASDRSNIKGRTVSTTQSAASSPFAGYDDWPSFTREADPFRAGSARARTISKRLGVRDPGGADRDVRVHAVAIHDGVRTTRLSWNTGFGPRTQAFLAEPAETPDHPMPGILGLHCHSGDKWSGAQRLVDSDLPLPDSVRRLRDHSYGGTAAANDLARRGNVVLVHDAFSWGSRRFPLLDGTWGAELLEGRRAIWNLAGIEPTTEMLYNALAGPHENLVSKAAGLLGTTYAGIIARDDLIALSVLSNWDSVDSGRLGCFGFSGGGCRSLLLASLDSRIRAYVVTCGMTTFASLIPEHVDIHSWLLCVPGLSQELDWPELAEPRSEQSLLVQFAKDDPHFSVEGMLAAHSRLRELHSERRGYRGEFWPGDHRFDAAMQEQAWQYLEDRL